MEKKKSFLFRLFGAVSGEASEEEKKAVLKEIETAPEEGEKAAEEQESIEQESIEQESPVKEEAVLPFYDRKLLELPGDHAVSRLYDLWTDEAGGQPSLRLYLEGLSGDCEERELGRLEKELTKEAEPRLKNTVVKVKKSREEDEAKEGAAEEVYEEKRNSLDAHPFVFVPADRMKAWIMVFPPVGGGGELSREMLEKALEKNKVSYGVDEGIIGRIPEEEDRYFRLFLAAEGKEAVNGEDGYIVDYFSRVVERRFEVDEHDRVDYTSLNIVQNADKGDVICEAVPATKGTPGMTVYGQELPGKDGKEAKLPKGRNTEISEDGTKLLACHAGHVEFGKEGFKIKTVLEIDSNVDYTTGNINFLGDVHIRGDVCSGFSVQAVGDITVDGVVESGTVEAGGDLVVVKGIVGDRDSVIRSHHDVYAKYIANSIVHVRGNLNTDSILHSDVYCDGEVKACSGKGTVIGGKLRAARGMEAKVVGSKSGSVTAVVLGGQPCANFEKKILLKEIEELDKEMKKLEKQPESPARTSRMNKIRLDLSINKVKLGRFDKELEKIKEKLEKQGGSRMKAQIAYPGLVVTIGDETKQLDRETSSCNARLVKGEIQWV